MNRTSDPNAIRICVDSVVKTSDDEELGVVCEIAGDVFKVDAPLARDFWLQKVTVLSADDMETRLGYDEEQVEALKLPGPDPASGSPVAAEQLDTFSSPGEQEARRRDMKKGYS